MSTPTIPATPHHIGWKHDRVCSVISEFQNAILAQVQSACLDESRVSTPAPIAISYQCKQDIEEERLPLFYQTPSHRIVAWLRWWHLTARALLVAYQKRYWGLLGQYLKTVKGQVSPHLALIRRFYGRGRGRLLCQLSDYSRK